MTLTVTLTQQEEARLSGEAERLGLTIEEYALTRLLAQPSPVEAAPLSPRQATAQWRELGIADLLAEAPDSPIYARELRARLIRRSPA